MSRYWEFRCPYPHLSGPSPMHCSYHVSIQMISPFSLSLLPRKRHKQSRTCVIFTCLMHCMMPSPPSFRAAAWSERAMSQYTDLLLPSFPMPAKWLVPGRRKWGAQFKRTPDPVLRQSRDVPLHAWVSCGCLRCCVRAACLGVLPRPLHRSYACRTPVHRGTCQHWRGCLRLPLFHRGCFCHRTLPPQSACSSRPGPHTASTHRQVHICAAIMAMIESTPGAHLSQRQCERVT